MFIIINFYKIIDLKSKGENINLNLIKFKNIINYLKN